jgi:hypothetical protein
MPSTSDDPIRKLYSVLHTEALDEFSAARLVRRVMAATESAAGAENLRRRAWVVRWASLAAAAAAIVLGVSLQQRHGGNSAPAPGVEIVDVRSNGGVHLRWADSGKDRYQVLKSASAADFSRASRKTVRGTQYVDSEPDPGQVVFYRVE